MTRSFGFAMATAVLAAATALALGGSPAHAQTTGVPGDDIVFLLTDCANSGHTKGSDCFEDLDSLQSFIWGQGGLHPDASDPLIVDIGAGTFTGTLSCPSGGGHVTFRGSGREHSVLQGTSAITVKVDGCEDLEFQDLTIQAPTSGGNTLAAVKWLGCGSSTWTDMDLLVRDASTSSESSAAWWDAGECQAVHYWFGSRVFNEGSSEKSFGFYVAGDDQHWFYGGDIKTEGAVDTPDPALQAAVYVAGTGGSGDVRIYGSTVRALTGEAVNVSYTLHESLGGFGFNAIMAHADDATVHVHGGIIVADASASNGVQDVDAAEASGGATFVHTLDTAYNVVPGQGGGTARRVVASGTGQVKSPFQWPAGGDPPAAKGQTGSDTFVETDCGSDGDCNGGGNETHLMIFNDAACPTQEWFDSTTGRCRNDTTP